MKKFKNHKLWLTMLGLTLLLALAACAPGPPPVASEPEDITASEAAPAPAPEDIQNIIWQWTDLVETEPASQSVVPDPEKYFIAFLPDGSIQGKADCNGVGGGYTIDGDQLTIELGPSTMMYCGDESLDQQFLALLSTVASFSLADGRLELHLADGAGTMGFANAGPVGAEEAPATDAGETEAETTTPSVADIQNITWQWADLVETQPAAQSVVPNPENYTIVFAGDNKVHIQADCNLVKGIYTVDGDKLTIQLGPSTMAFCGDESLDQQFLGLLITVGSYALEDGRLQLNLIEGAGAMGFDNGGAIEAAEAETTEPPVAEPQPEIMGIVWEWEAFQDQAELNDIDVPDPGQYTILLNPDGTYNIQADCNAGSGAYTLDGSSITFEPGPMTRAMCEPDSLDQQFLQYLGDVVTYVLTDEGKLALNLKMDAGNMIFRQGGAEGAGAGLDPDQISLDPQGLADAWQPVVVPAQPYDVSQPPGPKGMPEHIEILFGATDPADRQPGDPIMYIIPVNAYRQMWEENGNLAVSRTMEMIDQLSYMLTSSPETAGYPALPYEEIGSGYNDLAVQVGRATATDASASKNGYRFVGRWAQDANPVTNEGMRYVYQGFTNDGKYLVSFWWPVSTSQLPDANDDLSQEDRDAFDSDAQAYISAKAEMLNGLSTADWEPDLAKLDALVGSLQIEDMTATGLVGPEWQWLGTLSNDGQVKNRVEDPSAYRLLFNADGSYQFQADCNNGSGGYTIDGGMTGSFTMEAGPMTRAECGPDSLSTDMMNLMEAVQTYRVRAGGELLGLLWPAGGGIEVFQALDAAAE
ncbi:MAG TPA: META domain-containing protein [Caldilineae bacterium]|nr:META domain-containing protein [Caldilineae bacterium]